MLCLSAFEPYSRWVPLTLLLSHCYYYYMTHLLNCMKNILLFNYSTNILVRSLTVNVKGTFLPPKSENVRLFSSNCI